MPTTGGATTPIASAIHFFFFSMPENVVGIGTSLFYLQRAETAGIATFTRVDVDPSTGSATPPQTSATFSLDGVPLGLAADATHVAWSTTTDLGPYSNGGNGNASSIPNSCSIWLHSPSPQDSAKVLLHSSSFSCWGVAIDETAVYFAIVNIDSSQFDPTVDGIGIGRVTFDGAFESISTGFFGAGFGPRRIFLDGEDMFAVDPLAIAKIKKSALDGKVEIPN
jgi:hypothetical protein